MTTDADSGFLVGETIILTAQVSARGTRIPENATSLALDGIYLVAPGVDPVLQPSPDAGTAFTNVAVGGYELRVDSTGWTPGTYIWRAKGTDGSSGVALAEDTFVLLATTG